MRILVISDTHRNLDNFDRVLEREARFDMIVHCGDVERDEDYIRAVASCPVCMVAGNNDWGIALPREIMTEIGPYKVMIVHGHQYSVHYGLERICDVAKQKGADIVLFGHTHIPLIKKVDHLVLMNPGSLSKPRQPERIPTYGLIEIDEKNKKENPKFFLRELKK